MVGEILEMKFNLFLALKINTVSNVSNVSIQLKDFIPDEIIAIIFELKFKCEI